MEVFYASKKAGKPRRFVGLASFALFGGRELRPRRARFSCARSVGSQTHPEIAIVILRQMCSRARGNQLHI